MDNGQRIGLPEGLRNGCVLYLPGDVSGTTAFDASGSGNNGTLVNSPTVTRGGLWGYEGFSFNGSNQYVTIPNVDGDKSVFLSIKNTSAPGVGAYQDAYCNATSASDTGIYEIGIYNNAGTIQTYAKAYFGGGGPPASVSVDYNPTEWTHFGFTRTGGTMYAYLNGRLVGTSAYATGSASYGTYSNIGRYQDANNSGGIRYWNGRVANVTIHNRAISADEVRTLHEAFFTP